MKKLVITLIAILCVAGVCVVTCPDKQAHKDKIMSLINNKLNEEIDKADIGDGFAFLGSSIGSKIAEAVIDNRLEVKNHFVYSVGIMQKVDGPQTVSFGILGHVFTTSQSKFDSAFDNAAL